MSLSQFEQFKTILKTALQDENFVSNNSFLQDAATLQTYVDRIDAITDDFVLELDYSDWESSLGLLLQDASSRSLKFTPKGFENLLSEFREATIAEPRRIFGRSSVSDGIYYLLADGGISTNGQGVFLLNDSGEIIRRFAHFGTNIAAGDYEDPSVAITFSIGGIEYVAIADSTHHVVQIYLYDAPYTHQATIGTVDTPGAGADLLTNPNGIAVDADNSLLYVSCPTGQPAAATADNGFVAVYDISTIGTPAYDSIPLYYDSTGSLLDAEVFTPVDLVYDGSLLWVSNSGANHVGAFDVSGATPICTRFIETSGPGYTLRTPGQIYFNSTVGGFSRLYVVNTVTGAVEEFNASTFQHLNTYGIRASEDDLGSYTRLSDSVFGALGQPQGVAVGTVNIDDQDTNVMLVTDPENGRIQRFNLDAYTQDNFANFELRTFDVPITFTGWSLSGNLPLDMVSVQYRNSLTEEFRDMPQETFLPSTRTIQFRLKAELDTRKFVKSDWEITKLRIHGKQA